MNQVEYQITILKKRIIDLIAEMNLDVRVVLTAIEGIKLHCYLFHDIPVEVLKLQSDDVIKTYEELRKERGMD